MDSSPKQEMMKPKDVPTSQLI